MSDKPATSWSTDSGVAPPTGPVTDLIEAAANDLAGR